MFSLKLNGISQMENKTDNLSKLMTYALHVDPEVTSILNRAHWRLWSGSPRARAFCTLGPHPRGQGPELYLKQPRKSVPHCARALKMHVWFWCIFPPNLQSGFHKNDAPRSSSQWEELQPPSGRFKTRVKAGLCKTVIVKVSLLKKMTKAERFI